MIYTLLEKAATDSKEGRKPQLPLWLAPTQVRVIPLKDEFLEFSKNLVEKLSKKNIRSDIDDRNDSIGKRIREAEKEWIRYILVIGERESGSETLSIRDRNSNDVRELLFDDVVSEIDSQTKNKPYSGLNVPLLLSKRTVIQV